jgi:hypothetical protein
MNNKSEFDVVIFSSTQKRDSLEFGRNGLSEACKMPKFVGKDTCTPNIKQIIEEGKRLSREAKKVRSELEYLKKSTDDERTKMVNSLLEEVRNLQETNS